MKAKLCKQFQYGEHIVKLETGELANQASGSVLVNMGGTIVLATIVVSDNCKEGQSFFPLTVDYIEKGYAVGKFPGGYIKRENRASNHEVLIARIIDRSLRPLFPKDFYHDTHLIVQVLALNSAVTSDVVALLAASTTVMLAGLPIKSPLAGIRVGYIEDNFVINPKLSDMDNSQLDLFVSSTSDSVVMVESKADEIAENIMLDAIYFAQDNLKEVINNLVSFIAEVDPKPFEYIKTDSSSMYDKLKGLVYEKLCAAYSIVEKPARTAALTEIRSDLLKQFEDEEEHLIGVALHQLEATIVRSSILDGNTRIDGRKTTDIRPIDIKVDYLEGVHGSALFTRGETQALCTVTLGTKNDEQSVDIISGGYSEKFMLHYNFLPFSTGEVGRLGPPKRREIGHGNLAKRALSSVIPDCNKFPYTIRVVSEILESNGSSSMATVCGGCLSLLSAGVPVKKHVAGVAMGLILEGNKFAVLTDILGDEDHLGDMDFKVAGTRDGITALQMDIKTIGITRPIMHVALQQAIEGRMYILNLMEEAISEPNNFVDGVPLIEVIKINPNKIKDLIGRGGSVIKDIINKTNCSVDISEDGVVNIVGVKREFIDHALSIISDIMFEVEINSVYDGSVIKILERNAGIIVSLPGSKDGFVHVSQISNERISDVREVIKEGQMVKVKVVSIDERGRIRLSMKSVQQVDE